MTFEHYLKAQTLEYLDSIGVWESDQYSKEDKETFTKFYNWIRNFEEKIEQEKRDKKTLEKLKDNDEVNGRASSQ